MTYSNGHFYVVSSYTVVSQDGPKILTCAETALPLSFTASLVPGDMPAHLVEHVLTQLDFLVNSLGEPISLDFIGSVEHLDRDLAALGVNLGLEPVPRAQVSNSDVHIVYYIYVYMWRM